MRHATSSRHDGLGCWCPPAVEWVRDADGHLVFIGVHEPPVATVRHRQGHP